MRYTVTNGETLFSTIDIFTISGSSSFMIGDMDRISLLSAGEAPLASFVETVISQGFQQSSVKKEREDFE